MGRRRRRATGRPASPRSKAKAALLDQMAPGWVGRPDGAPAGPAGGRSKRATPWSMATSGTTGIPKGVVLTHERGRGVGPGHLGPARGRPRRPPVAGLPAAQPRGRAGGAHPQPADRHPLHGAAGVRCGGGARPFRARGARVAGADRAPPGRGGALPDGGARRVRPPGGSAGPQRGRDLRPHRDRKRGRLRRSASGRRRSQSGPRHPGNTAPRADAAPRLPGRLRAAGPRRLVSARATAASSTPTAGCAWKGACRR